MNTFFIRQLLIFLNHSENLIRFKNKVSFIMEISNNFKNYTISVQGCKYTVKHHSININVKKIPFLSNKNNNIENIYVVAIFNVGWSVYSIFQVIIYFVYIITVNTIQTI